MDNQQLLNELSLAIEKQEIGLFIKPIKHCENHYEWKLLIGERDNDKIKDKTTALKFNVINLLTEKDIKQKFEESLNKELSALRQICSMCGWEFALRLLAKTKKGNWICSFCFLPKKNNTNANS